MYIPLRCVLRLRATFVSWRCIFEVEFVQVFSRANERWRLAIASHEERGIVCGMANGDMAIAGDDCVIIEDVVGSDQKRERLCKVGQHFGEGYNEETARDCKEGRLFRRQKYLTRAFEAYRIKSKRTS